jgi:hypothetical protein
MRRCEKFLDLEKGHPPPIFGLTQMPKLLGSCPTLQEKLVCIRRAAIASKVSMGGAIIRYFDKESLAPFYVHALRRGHGIKRKSRTREEFERYQENIETP